MVMRKRPKTVFELLRHFCVETIYQSTHSAHQCKTLTVTELDNLISGTAWLSSCVRGRIPMVHLPPSLGRKCFRECAIYLMVVRIVMFSTRLQLFENLLPISILLTATLLLNMPTRVTPRTDSQLHPSSFTMSLRSRVEQPMSCDVYATLHTEPSSIQVLILLGDLDLILLVFSGLVPNSIFHNSAIAIISFVSNTIWPFGHSSHFLTKALFITTKRDVVRCIFWGMARGLLKVYYCSFWSVCGVFFPKGTVRHCLFFFFIPPLFITAYIIRSWSRRLQKQWPLWSKCIP
ncbi:hypothetical protein FOQG_09516 [Fusarium oxysporum f. sp. raphani 54005]|uniref:Uncharacterized protein n=1 Tax=Fusarium oxysporum f. sp. raphani 54005 TaxID=1089458 RepID=X0CW21_FUSOX|nr:hypothetical protein FOQG_09516 [Fusarium oxysporum f. sp. raphani 54005]